MTSNIPFARVLDRLSWSIKDAASELQVSRSTIKWWRTARSGVPLGVLQRLESELARRHESAMADLQSVRPASERRGNSALGAWRARRAAQKEKAGL